MKKLLILMTLTTVAFTAFAVAQGPKGQGHGQGRGGGQQQGHFGGQQQDQGMRQGQHGGGDNLSCDVSTEVSQALYEALMSPEGEYAAYATYGAVIDKFGQVEPYVSIQQAEANHINALKRVMDNNGISYPPENPYLGKIEAPESLKIAAEAWAKGEIANVELYDRLLKSSTDCSSASQVFNNLRDASLNMHLPAFELAAQNGGTLSLEQMQSLSINHSGRQGGQHGNGQNGRGNGNNTGHGQGYGQQAQNGFNQRSTKIIIDEFNEHDSDGNGYISKQEFFEVRSANITERSKQGYPMKNIANTPLFEDMDANSDEQISMEEFGTFEINHQMQRYAIETANQAIGKNRLKLRARWHQ